MVKEKLDSASVSLVLVTGLGHKRGRLRHQV